MSYRKQTLFKIFWSEYGYLWKGPKIKKTAVCCWLHLRGLAALTRLISPQVTAALASQYVQY